PAIVRGSLGSAGATPRASPHSDPTSASATHNSPAPVVPAGLASRPSVTSVVRASGAERSPQRRRERRGSQRSDLFFLISATLGVLCVSAVSVLLHLPIHSFSEIDLDCMKWRMWSRPPALASVPDMLKPPKGSTPTRAPVILRLKYRLPT